MKKGIWGIVLAFSLFCFLFGCGSNDAEKARVEKEGNGKDRIEKVGDAASEFGYDGEKIKKGLRDVNDQSKAHDKAADDIFDQ